MVLYDVKAPCSYSPTAPTCYGALRREGTATVIGNIHQYATGMSSASIKYSPKLCWSADQEQHYATTA